MSLTKQNLSSILLHILYTVTNLPVIYFHKEDKF